MEAKATEQGQSAANTSEDIPTRSKGTPATTADPRIHFNTGRGSGPKDR